MVNFWSDQGISMYEAACTMVNYPEIPLKSYFTELIGPDDTVMDLGSGPGVVTLYLSPLCKSVTAVEQDLDACEHLKKRARERGIENINIINSNWPDQALKPCDVTIVLYVNRILENIEGARNLINSTRRAGMIMCPHANEGKSFHESLNRRLGFKTKFYSCLKGCRIAAFLEAAGGKVRCEKVRHEFGQPVSNIDEAALFMCQQLHLGNEYLQQIRELAGNYIEMRNGEKYIPLERINCLIIFEK